MILQNELTLTTPVLGCKIVPGKPRQLLRNPEKLPGLVELVWQAAFTEAASRIGVSYTSDMVGFPTGYSASKYVEYVRKYGRNNEQVETFEAIPAGASISFEVVLNESKLDPKMYADILHIVGEYQGVSQWGVKRGYGRFKVNTIKRKTLHTSLQINFDDLRI